MTLKQSFEKVWEFSKISPQRVFWVNAHAINISEKNQEFKHSLKKAEFLLNDGFGIEIASIILNKPIKENLNGTDWIPAFLDYLQGQNAGYSIFLLGSHDEVLEKSIKIFQQRWPGLPIAGCNHGYFANDISAIIKKLEKTQPSILLACMGMPKQELFITQNWQAIQLSGIKIALAGGAFFDFLTGIFPRAPKWMRKLRMEWVYRLYNEPKRLAKRYLLGNVIFFWILFKEVVKKLIYIIKNHS